MKKGWKEDRNSPSMVSTITEDNEPQSEFYRGDREKTKLWSDVGYRQVYCYLTKFLPFEEKKGALICLKDHWGNANLRRGGLCKHYKHVGAATPRRRSSCEKKKNSPNTELLLCKFSQYTAHRSGVAIIVDTLQRPRAVQRGNSAQHWPLMAKLA